MRRKPGLIFHSCLPGPSPDLWMTTQRRGLGQILMLRTGWDLTGVLLERGASQEGWGVLGIIPRPPCFLLSHQQSDLPAQPTCPTMNSQQWKPRPPRHDTRRLPLRDTAMWILDEAPGRPDVEGRGWG